MTDFLLWQHTLSLEAKVLLSALFRAGEDDVYLIWPLANSEKVLLTPDPSGTLQRNGSYADATLSELFAGKLIWLQGLQGKIPDFDGKDENECCGAYLRLTDAGRKASATLRFLM